MKKIFALLLCLCLMIPLAACGGDPVDTGNIPSDTSSDVASSATDSNAGESSDGGEEEAVPNLILAMDYWNKRIVLYDLDLLEDGLSLDLAEEWVFDKIGSTAAGLKYREDTVFGDVIIISKGMIVSYPEGEVLWSIKGSKGSPVNAHCVEILPSGNLVIADSDGGDRLRLFYTSRLLNGDTEGAQEFVDVPLEGGHGALWDPEYEVLWALGNKGLYAYNVKGDADDQKLVKIPDMGAEFASDNMYGHSLTPDYTDKQYLWVTNNKQVFRFNKETGELEEKYKGYAKLSKTSVKGFGNNENGNFMFCSPDIRSENDTDWKDTSVDYFLTDTICFAYWKSENFLYLQEYVSEKAGFYKTCVFNGKYQ